MADFVDDDDEPIMGLSGEDLGLKGVGNIDVFEGSMCMTCEGSGKTRVMIHKIPYFREIIISSFRCDDCYDSNTEVSFGGEIQLQGCKYRLLVKDQSDLDRQLIKSDSARVLIEELELEIPPMTQKGEISTIEGFLRTAAKNLGLYQDERMAADATVGAKVALVITGLTQMAMGDRFPFNITVDDCAGNSFIQNPSAPLKDPNMTTTYYKRSKEQTISLGLNPDSEELQYRDDTESNFQALAAGGFGRSNGSKRHVPGSIQDEAEPEPEEDKDNEAKQKQEAELGRTEAVALPSPCPSCQKPGNMLTALTDIPHFKEVIIMSFTCEYCGFRNNEVKGGGAIPTRGTEVTLIVKSELDLHRDVLKSDSCSVEIPEIELEMQHGTLGGTYTTIEGLIAKLDKSLSEGNPFSIGDSSNQHHSEKVELQNQKSRFAQFMKKLRGLAKGEMYPFTIIMRDPLGNSFVSPRIGLEISPQDDEYLYLKDYDRSWDENEEFGLNDINTRDFESGVEYDDEQVVLADRLTHVVPKGADHPHEFAKGMDDDMTGGIYRGKVKDAVKYQNQFLDNNNNNNNNNDSCRSNVANSDIYAMDLHDINFDEQSNYQGPRVGKIFKMGRQGLGYYTDADAT
jgi:zinc finger protein